jgi:hypothetical protein
VRTLRVNAYLIYLLSAVYSRYIHLGRSDLLL